MMLEIHNVNIGQLITKLSLTVDNGQIAGITGAKNTGKTTLLRAVLGFLPVDSGHICIDGELLTPLSAPYFRRYMAYVPQQLSVPKGYTGVPTGYLQRLEKAVRSDKALLVVDEPQQPLCTDEQEAANQLLAEAAARGATVLAVNPRNMQTRVEL